MSTPAGSRREKTLDPAIADHLAHLQVERRLAPRTLAMYGAATSSFGSKVSRGDRPGSLGSHFAAYSSSAQRGLSRSFCIS